MGSNAKVSKWCLYTRSVQDYPDVCLVGRRVFDNAPSSKDDADDDGESEIQENLYQYYSWYRISHCVDGKPVKTVYRRLRMASSADGYPVDCIVVDSLTANELGLCETNRDILTDGKYEEYTHFRNTKIVTSRSKRASNCGDSPKEFENRNEVEAVYRVFGFPINKCDDDESIVLSLAGNDPLSVYGRTIRHPDYALSFASKIALCSIVIALISFITSAISCAATFCMT